LKVKAKMHCTAFICWDFVYNDYLKGFKGLHVIVRIQEHNKIGNGLLSARQTKTKEDGDFLPPTLWTSRQS